MRTPPVKGRKRVKFEFAADPGSEVHLAGAFNDWNATAKPLQDVKGDGTYRTTLLLPKGRYEYKFVVNGMWCIDPHCPEWVPNSFGSLNSVLIVE